MIVYPAYAEELVNLLQEDQAEKKALGRLYFKEKDSARYAAKKAQVQKSSSRRTKRMLEILDEIGEPSISNIGAEAAQAISVLAIHDKPSVLKRVLKAFTDLYRHDKNNSYYQAIPSMTDLLLILERKPQRFGTQWLFDKNKQPFLPYVEDFEQVNERRAKYGIEPLRWPKSLAIPESEQPWLTRPLSELVMRDLTNEEYDELASSIK